LHSLPGRYDVVDRALSLLQHGFREQLETSKETLAGRVVVRRSRRRGSFLSHELSS
jgi:hypothetical protein